MAIGLDLAKSVFQAHGVDENGVTVLVKKLRRKQMLPFFSKWSPCLIGVEPLASIPGTKGLANVRSAMSVFELF